MTPAVPGLIEFLERVGFTFGTDEDRNTHVGWPVDVTTEDIADALKPDADAIGVFLERRAELQRHCYVSGPRQGQRHYMDPVKCEAFGIHAGRRKWEAYELLPDGRAIFRGIATSRKKAEQLVWDNQLEFNARSA